MSTTATSPALSTAQAYHLAWTGHDLDSAMRYVADDILCRAPGALIEGALRYRAFLGGFMATLTGVETFAAFGDEETAALFYYPHTSLVSDAPTAEYFTVTGGKITSTVLVFDRPSFAPQQS
jgi:hypothetical protein